MNKEKWLYQFGNNEIWMQCEEFDTKEEAIQAGLEEIEKDESLRDSLLYVGQKEKVHTSSIDIDSLLENVAENTICELSEVGEDYLMDVSIEAQDELEEKLNDVFFKWIEKYNYEPKFYKIVNIEEVDIPIKRLFACNEDGVTEWCVALDKKQAYDCMIDNWGKETMDEYEKEFIDCNPDLTTDDFINDFFTEEISINNFTLDSENGVTTKTVKEWLEGVETVPSWFAYENY